MGCHTSKPTTILFQLALQNKQTVQYIPDREWRELCALQAEIADDSRRGFAVRELDLKRLVALKRANILCANLVRCGLLMPRDEISWNQVMLSCTDGAFTGL